MATDGVLPTGGARPMSGMGRRRAVIAVLCVTGVAAAGVGTWAVLDAPWSSAAAADTERSAAAPARATAPVTKGALADTKVFAGVLGYGAASGVAGVASGTLTWLPQPGDVIHRDEPVYAVDERAVRSMHGTTPMWRDLAVGTTGADVLQLNENLAALGYDVSVDRVFGKRTLAAVERWQRDRDHTVTGVLTKDDVVFLDGDVRVESAPGTLGQPVDGDVLTVTSTKQVVTATVPQRDAGRLAVGTAVRLLVNGTGDPVDGTVTDAEPATTEQNGEVVNVTVSFNAGRRTLPTAASVRVEAVGQTQDGILSVPVAALVAASASASASGSGSSGFAVDVVRRDGTTKRVPVTVGLVADGRAAVTGDVHAGDRVVVPS
ncbi:peptidoglycan-binding protein [Curtobacterium sp. ISL-83]|uniref:peptidoglycan-binding protein n=1 Tax=Curtobacterium sp. ISL-83 TaxID=2819145 RepID=UPI001BE69A06|nr:peptidoglycan-binding protein [Curtobacterium sp. ISL-83]MBT2502655.1 peptidoglycan-binding protein [Curtobacterium sp. ISL-83]